MDEKKKNKLKKWLIYGGLALLVLFVVITSAILYSKKAELDRLKKENDRITEEIVMLV